MPTNLLTLENVERVFSTAHGAVRAVDGASLEIAPGESLGLVGESGSGKTTLGRLAIRLESVTSGRVLYDGIDITNSRGEKLRRMRTEFQMIFQDPASSLDPRMRVRELVAEPLVELKRMSRAEVNARVEEVIDLVRLPAHVIDRYPRQLSGGQAQRVSIARALSVAPRLVVADEPVSALDASVSTQVVSLLDDLKKSLGVSYLFVSHDLSVVRYICDRVAVMYLGRIVESGPTEQVFTRPQHPYTAALLSATPDASRTLNRGRERILLHGDPPDPSNIPAGCRFQARCPIGPAVRGDRDICKVSDPTLGPTEVGTVSACHFAREVDELGSGYSPVVGATSDV